MRRHEIVAALDLHDAQNADPVPPTWTEAWRHACEVRFVKSLPAERRTEYLDGVARARGAAAAHRLRKDAAR